MRAFLFACAMILFVAFNFAFAAEKSEGGASSSTAVGGANSPIYSQVEIDAKLSQLESEALNQREVAGLRVDHLEKQIAESKRYIDRILLMFVVSCALIIFLVVNNMRHQQRGASQKMRRLIKDAEDAVGEVRRHLDRPEADHMRAGRALRVVMRRLRDGSAMALPQHLSRQVVSAAADAYLPAGLHLMANALRAEQAGSWREAAVYLERLNAMEDGDPDVLLHLAHVYKNLADDNPGEDGKAYLRLSLQYYQRFALRDKENREVARGETAESAAHFEDKDKIPELEEKKRARLSAMPMPPMPQSSGNGAGKEQSNRAPAASEKSNGSGKSTETVSARSTPIPPSSLPIVEAKPPLQVREKPVIAPPPAMKIESPPELPKASPPQAREKPVIAPPPAMKIESPPELPKASPPQAREKPVIAPPSATKIESPPELPKASPPLQAREKPVIAPPPAMKIESPPELPKANLPPQVQEKPVIAPPPAMKIESPPELPKASPPPQAREKPVVAPSPAMKIESPPELPKASPPPQAREKPVVAPPSAMKIESPPELPKANLLPQVQEKPVVAPPPVMKIESPPELPKASPPPQAREKPVVAPPSAMKIESPPELPKANLLPQVQEKPVVAPPPVMKIESPPELPKASPLPQAQEKPVVAPPPAMKIESPPELPKASPPPQAQEKPVIAPPPAMKIESPPELPKVSPPPQAQENPVVAPTMATKTEPAESRLKLAEAKKRTEESSPSEIVPPTNSANDAPTISASSAPPPKTQMRVGDILRARFRRKASEKKRAPIPIAETTDESPEGQMRALVQQANELLARAQDSKSSREKRRLLDQALNIFEQAQRQKTSEMLYYHWGIALLARALDSPTRQRERWFANAADKFKAGNVLAPKAFDFRLASLYAIADDEENCRRWLVAAAESGQLDSAALVRDPDFETMRAKPWFRQYLADAA